MNDGVRILQDPKSVKFDKNFAILWKFSVWEYASIKTQEEDLEIWFVKLTTFCIRNLRLKYYGNDKNLLHYYYGGCVTPMQANVNN